MRAGDYRHVVNGGGTTLFTRLARKRIEKRSPIDRRILYSPGASIRNRQIDLMVDALGWYMALLGFVAGAVSWETSLWITNTPRLPFIAMGLGVIVVLGIWYKSSRLFAELERLQLGREGEELMGQILVELRVHGYRAFHDLRARDFNVDHVLVGPGGVFAIETKTVSKPVRGAGKVVHEGDRVTINGLAPDRDPLVQSRAAAGHVREVLRQMTGRDVVVKPVLVYPGWYVESRARDADILVQNEKYLLKAIAALPRRITETDTQFLCAAIERHILEQLHGTDAAK